jgi:hypothetical protein
MRRYDELSKDQELLLPRQFCSDCIIATRGYDFREGHPSPDAVPSGQREKTYFRREKTPVLRRAGALSICQSRKRLDRSLRSHKRQGLESRMHFLNKRRHVN